MPVSIPRLNKIEPTALTSPVANDRINMQVKDNASMIMNRTQSIVNLGDKVGEVYTQYENEKIDQLASEAEREYTAWNNDKLQKLRSYEGDPTDAYVDYDKESKDKYNEILNKRPDINDRMKRHLTSRLDNIVGNQQVSVLKQRGLQQEVYDNNLFESTVKLKRDDLPIRAGEFDENNPKEVTRFDAGINDIKTLVSKQGLKKGIATQLPNDAKSWSHEFQDDDGNMVKVAMSPMAKVKLAKELNEGVKSSLDALVGAGELKKAEAFKEKYKDYLQPEDLTKIQTKISSANRKDEAYKFVGTLRGKSEDAQISAIENLKDPELRSEALKIKNADDAALDALKTRKQKANYELLAKEVGSTQMYGIADLEKNPIYSKVWDNLSAKQQEAIKQSIVAPKNTDPKAVAKIQELFLGNDPNVKLEELSPADFNEKYLVGLNKSDRTRYQGMYNNLVTNTAGEQRAGYKRAGEFLKNHLLVGGYIEKNKFGRLEGEDDNNLINAQSELMGYLSSRTQLFNNDKALNDFVKEFSASKIKEQVFNPAPVVRKQSAPLNTQAILAPIEPTKNPVNSLTAPQKFKLKRMYIEKNGGSAPDNADPKFIDFVQRNLSTLK